MSADMMIICEEDDSSAKGENSELAFFVDETSMGEPWSEFGKWFAGRFCGAPSMFDQMAGYKEHAFTRITQSDCVGVEHAIVSMQCHDNLNKGELIFFLRNHIGKHISTENW
jgi:hypothetical protein